jgi:hypothetical protein
MPTTAVTDWLDGLETVLEAESRLSGLLEHSSTVGQAREFLVTRILQTVLPPSVHIGSGKIIDSDGNYSKQIDIVIYDPRFPLMKVEGGGLYFVEGVLATIEVKSTINSSALRTALDNCKSVLQLVIIGEHQEEASDRIEFYKRKDSLTFDEAQDQFNYMLHPATYIFAFRSSLSFDSTCVSIREWWESIGCANSTYFPLLPRVIKTANIVGITNDGRIRLQNDRQIYSVMNVFETRQRFRWFALHLMDAVSARLGQRNFAEQFDYRLSDYYPLDEFRRGIASGRNYFIDRVARQPPAE